MISLKHEYKKPNEKRITSSAGTEEETDRNWKVSRAGVCEVRPARETRKYPQFCKCVMCDSKKADNDRNLLKRQPIQVFSLLIYTT